MMRQCSFDLCLFTACFIESWALEMECNSHTEVYVEGVFSTQGIHVEDVFVCLCLRRGFSQCERFMATTFTGD